MKHVKKQVLFGLFLMCMAMLLCSSDAYAAKKGWVKQGGSTYYYDLTTGAKIVRQWKEIDGQLYYFDGSGKLICDKWVGDYHVGSTGSLDQNKWIGEYFVGEDGKWIKNFKAGWYKINKKWYYYTKKGKKKTGWLKYKGNKYYLDSNGVRVTKWYNIKNKTYYFTKKGIMKNTSWKKKGGWYYPVSSNGVRNKGERMNKPTVSAATKIQYQTSTLKVRIQKHKGYSSNYWIAQITIKNPAQMFSALSYGTYGGLRETTSHAVTRNNAIIGINGSAFSYNTGKPCFDAVKIQNGKIYNRAGGTSYSNCAILWDGTIFTPKVHLSAEQLVNMGVKDTFNFGPPLIENGKKVNYNMANSGNNWSLVSYKDPRSVVGMVKSGEYVLLVADGRGSGGSMGLTRSEMQKIMQKYGCTYAYNMDGGGSATLAYRGTVLNRPSDGSERPCGDFLIFKE